MKAFVILTFALTAGAALADSYYDQPYSIIMSERTPSADPLLRTVIVNRVDDENAEHGGSYAAYGYAVVAPGPHKVTLDLPRPPLGGSLARRRGFTLATQITFDLETRPCVRYIVAAELKTEVTREWTPIVRREERIGECEAKFHIVSGVK